MLTTSEGNRAMIELGHAAEQRVFHPVVTTSEFLIRVLDVVGTWADRARERRQLLALDERMLADIASDRSRVFCEAEKPFWRR